ncbi:MAG: nanoRNase/pAp phosphatase (c-di-AMP/oligoRNAs hydrolase) [Cellvibrionaceae bacterium]|jgi:nanoRNase/pAp phosphatase (c-di-AMP/oligoRNAs hydrolase)
MNLTQQKLAALKTSLEPYGSVTIMPHIDPDPDAIAAVAGLKRLFQVWGKTVFAYYEGRIGRAENKSLMIYLDRPLVPLLTRVNDPIILVDTQPAAGNSPISAKISVHSVIDHHIWNEQTQTVPFHDVRSELGACATLVTEYLQAASIIPDEKLATALYYGIKSDTLDLERQATAQDIAAYDYLRPLIDKIALAQIEKAQVSASYFQHAYDALRSAYVYDNLLISYVGEMSYPDLPAEIADWLMRFEKAVWTICIGLFKDKIYISVRGHPPREGADSLVQAMVAGLGTGGGHGSMAGGQVLIEQRNPTVLVRQLRKNALRFLNIPDSIRGQRLLDIRK